MSWLDFNSAEAQVGATPKPDWQAPAPQFNRDEVFEKVTSQLEAVLGYLYPNGFADKKGSKFYIGSISGEEGESLSVELNGPKAGLWHDFATAEGGDIFDLWKEARGLASFRETLKDAGEFAGATANTPRRTPKRKSPKGGEAWGQPTATYRYTDPAGSILAEVERFDWVKDGKAQKTFRPWDVVTRSYRAPETRPLYNLPNIASAAEIVVVEGEKAADALISQNIDATTAMGGAAAPMEKTDWSIVRGRKVVIWPDNDGPGKAYADKLRQHLDAEGALAVSVLSIPSSRPDKWDAADAEGEDLGALIGAMRTEFVENSSALILEQWGDLQDVQVQWLIGGLIPQGAMAALYGQPGSYKSFVAMYLAAMVAEGLDCFFRASERGRVVYVMGEGGAGAYRRAKALEDVHKIARPNVSFLRSALDLRGSMDDAMRLKDAILQTGDAPALIVIDTLARNFGGGNENSSEDMGAFIRVIGELQNELGCAVLIVHHSGKDDAKGMRGHSSLFGAVDTELEVVKVSEEDDPRRIGEITVTKQKDGEDGFGINYEMHLVDFGNERTSLAVLPVEGDYKKPSSLSPTATTFMKHIRDFFQEETGHHKSTPMPNMPMVPTAVASMVKDYCRAKEGHDTYTPAAFRQRWRRAISDLKATGKIGVWEDKLWLIEA